MALLNSVFNIHLTIASLLLCLFIFQISRAYLLFPNPTLLQLVIAVQVPTTLKHHPFAIAAGYQLNFAEPFNVSQFNPDSYIIRAKRSNDLATQNQTKFDTVLTRSYVYKYIEAFIDSIGFNGHECLLRTICEVGEYPLVNKPDFILEDILHFLLTPSMDDSPNKMQLLEYQIAENVGRNNQECLSSYPQCKISLLDLITDKVPV